MSYPDWYLAELRAEGDVRRQAERDGLVRAVAYSPAWRAIRAKARAKVKAKAKRKAASRAKMAHWRQCGW